MTLSSENPLLSSWTGPFEAPPFSQVRPEHFRPAFDAAIAERRAEIEAIKADPAPAGFRNTILALERAGKTLDRVYRVFGHLASADTNDEIEAIEREIAPVLSRESNALLLDEPLFRRVDAVWAQREGLAPEEYRLVERLRLGFVRAGAGLAEEKLGRLKHIGERLATLGATFGQNVLADEREYLMLLDGADDLVGLPADFVAASATTAAARGHAGKYAVTLSRSSIEPFLAFAGRRDLREKAWRAFVARGSHEGAHDNRPIMSEMLALRHERARLLGYATYADYRLDDTMARKPQAAEDLMRKVWAPAREQALEDAKALQSMITEEGGNFELKPWDWRYYAEKRRQSLFAFDESALKAHLRLENVIEAAFHVAHRLFGLSFQPRSDINLPHADARAWTVFDASGDEIALFIGDYFNRASKHSGAWMSALRSQERLDGRVKPIISNVMNFARAPEGEASLLSYDEARTLFHEFGHALHGILSDVTYASLAGTNVSRDFVELPSQLYEHWLDEPEVLRRFARHHQTGEPMPEALLDKLQQAKRYGQGFATVEFLASGLFDMAAHRKTSDGPFDAMAIEAETLAEIGMPEAIAPRHGAAHFQHVFANSSGYSAGYYSYLWSEVLDADAFEAFKATGDAFEPQLAARLKRYVYSAGNLRAPDEAYAAFRGRAPTPDALLRKRGFAA